MERPPHLSDTAATHKEVKHMNSLDWEWELACAWTSELNRLDEAAEAALLEDDEA